MDDLLSNVWRFLADSGGPLFRAAFVVLLALVGARVLRRFVSRVLEARLDRTQAALFQGISTYLLYALAITWALKELGFEPGVLLGAAGILTVAVGFASQTAVSNLVGGLFLIFERPFAVGDIVRIDTTTGEVLSVDLLSVKLRTFDNLYVRVPNEQMLKTMVTTLTRFPIRRVDLKIGVAYKEDLKKVREILARVAEKNLMCLDEPAPLLILEGFGDSAVQIQYSVWGKRESFLDLRNAMYEEVKAAFDAEGIEIPFPHLSLYAGAASTPMPVRLVSADGQDRGG